MFTWLHKRKDGREQAKIRVGISIILCTGFSEQITEGRTNESGIYLLSSNIRSRNLLAH